MDGVYVVAGYAMRSCSSYYPTVLVWGAYPTVREAQTRCDALRRNAASSGATHVAWVSWLPFGDASGVALNAHPTPER